MAKQKKLSGMEKVHWMRNTVCGRLPEAPGCTCWQDNETDVPNIDCDKCNPLVQVRVRLYWQAAAEVTLEVRQSETSDQDALEEQALNVDEDAPNYARLEAGPTTIEYIG